jgi:hypothetical protein
VSGVGPGHSDATCTDVAPVLTGNSITRISTADAAKLYGIPARTIRRWHDEGRITGPAINHGRYMWNAEEIDQMARLRHGRARLRRANIVAHTP